MVLLVGKEVEKLNTGITFELALVRVNNEEEINFWDWPAKVAGKKYGIFYLESGTISLSFDQRIRQFQWFKKIGILDYGMRANVLREVAKHGLLVVVMSPTVIFWELLSDNLSGLVVFNGPGRPEIVSMLILLFSTPAWVIN